MNEPASALINLTEQEMNFIQEHIHDNVPDLLLQANRHKEMDMRKVAVQITARQKARQKLPDWYANPTLFFPPPLSVEQSSSEATARFKASLISGQRLIEITGGMGVDCYYMSQSFEKTIYFEKQMEVAQATAYNFAQLGVLPRIEVRVEEAIIALKKRPEPSDWIFADPARRDQQQRKVAQLADCTPDIPQALPVLFRSAPRILIKTAPLLDIDLAINQLQYVREVYVIGLENECKEVLYALSDESQQSEEVHIRVRLLHENGSVVQAFDFTRKEEAQNPIMIHDPGKYLYEPHAAILKAGPFKTLAIRYMLEKLATNTHLYTSDELIPDFPGRSFEIMAICKPDAREVARYVKNEKANLTTRNFPVKTDDLRRKLRLKEGGDLYLFATQLQNNQKVVIVTKKAYIN